MEFEPLYLSFKLAFFTTLLLFSFCIPFSYFLMTLRPRLRSLIEASANLPLVLPPTVLGFYLLIFLAPNSPIGQFLDSHLSIRFLFTFQGLVLASFIYSFPFMFQPILASFLSFPRSILELSSVLGKTKINTLRTVVIPLVSPALVKACMMTFAHTIGEFGVILMVGGNIPGETRVASVAIYDHFENMNYDQAQLMSIVLLVISFILLWLMAYLTNKDYLRNATGNK